MLRRLRKSMAQKSRIGCELGECLLRGCDLTECPVEEWVSELKEVMTSIPEDEAIGVSKVFTALSDPLRIKILRLLANKGELCACEIQAAIGKSQPFTSYHLTLLEKAGLLKAEKRGMWVFYRVRSLKVGVLLDAAEEMLAQPSTSPTPMTSNRNPVAGFQKNP